MAWTVGFHEEFQPEFEGLGREVQDEILALSLLLERYGPQLGRPHADTLAGSRHANMKELRFRAEGGVWRVAFAFDPERSAILLVAGNKVGAAQARFYRTLIRTADARFTRHLERLGKSP